MAECTTNDCEDDAKLFLCGYHINALQAWLDKCAQILPELDVTIARLDNVRQPNNEGGNGTKSAGSSAPANLDALQLKINLASLTETAEHYAKDQFAAGIAWTVQDWYTKAELLISGPEEDSPNPWAIANAREKLADHFPESMTPRECAKWLRENSGIKINAGKINDWHRRGKVRKHPGSTPKRPLYSPKEVLTVHLTRQHE
ncbi:hypothetical protein [Arthrobacter sp. S41]|uniref:hypothetical protein n=1 Tax=Arthrobacter sp. S41 TaxID=2509721 RepID=UPI0010360928|nr:hypothetical protein [Arthrobacter sp. S41]TAP26846.1 hypothetical protein EYR88_00300 [Arthrobacter sp. S41]